MLPGYHVLLRNHAALAVLSRDVDVPKPELAIDFAEIKNPIIPPVPLKPQMPVRVKVSQVKTSDDLQWAGTGKMFTGDDFPKVGWLGPDIGGI